MLSLYVYSLHYRTNDSLPLWFRQPLAFNLTLSRTYRWQTENKEDQTKFLEDLVRLFRTVTNGQAPLQLDNVQDFNITAGKVMITQ